MAMEDTARSGRRFMLRTAQSLPLEWAFDTGLRPRPFPDEAASLLPGPLSVTRTGLTPASDDELTTQDQPPTRSTSCLLGALKRLIAEWLATIFESGINTTAIFAVLPHLAFNHFSK